MDRPNIILIMTDQQRADTIGALGAPWMQTPYLDRLATEGAAFSECFVVKKRFDFVAIHGFAPVFK